MKKLKKKGQLFKEYKKYRKNKSNNSNDDVDNSSSNSNNINNSSISSSGRYIYCLSNYLINIIIGFVFEDYPKQIKQSLEMPLKSDNVYLKNKEILNLSLVSKQFIKVLSNQSLEFPLLAPIQLENNGNWSFIYNSPIEMNYEYFKHIKYSNNNKKQLNSLFSKIETFTICTDEFDFSTDSGLRRYIDDYYDYNEHYDELSLFDDYLIYPPPMPSLKNLIIDEYYGNEDNYSKFFSHIIKTSSKVASSSSSSSSSPPSNSNIGTIEKFSITIRSDWQGEPSEYSYKVFNFFENLLNYHSNSLKIIEINFDRERYSSVVGLLQIYKTFIDTNKTTTTNKIKFIINDPYSKKVNLKKDYKELYLFLEAQK